MESWSEKRPRMWLWLLKAIVFLTLGSRAWLNWRGKSSIREVLWNEESMTSGVEYWLLIPWESYAATSEPYIGFSVKLIAIALAVCAVASLCVTEKTRRLRDLLVIGSALLLADSIFKWADKDFQLGLLIEHLLQVISPLLLLLALFKKPQSLLWQYTAKIGLALCFIGHGLYAIGHHPQPGHFVTMCIDSLGMSQAFAEKFLVGAGYLDFAVAALIFAPKRIIIYPALVYMTAWGFLTALARVWTHYTPAEKYYGIDPWLFETLVRTSHWAIPALLLLTLWSGRRSKQSSENK